MHCSYSEGQSLTWRDSLVIFASQASSLAGVLSSDRIHLAERVRTPGVKMQTSTVKLLHQQGWDMRW